MVAGSEDDERRTVLIDFAGPHPAFDLSYSQRIAYGGVSVSRCVLPGNPGAEIGAAQFTVAIHDGPPFDMEWRLPGMGEPEHRRIVVDDAHINPADRPFFQRWSGTPRLLVVALERSFLNPIIDEAYGSRGVTLRTVVGVRDSTISGVARVWRQELDEGGPGGRLLTESLGVLLAVHVLRTYGEGVPRSQPIKGGLGPNRLAHVIEHIDGNLQCEVGLRDLAAIAGVSPAYFSEAFKASTGLTPYRYLIERRIRRAKELLRTQA